MDNKQIAETIIQQLGRSTGAMAMMIGAKNFSYGDKCLNFRFAARSRNSSNAMRITIDPSDTYTVEFLSCRGSSRKVKGCFSGIYAEDLKGLFERETGLYLSLR